MNIVNLTPHDVVLYCVEDTITEGKTVMVAAEAAPRAIFPKSGVVARARQTESVTGNVNGIDVLSMSYGDVEDLPPPRKTRCISCQHSLLWPLAHTAVL